MRGILLIIITVFLGFCSRVNTGEIKAPGVVDGDVITLKSQVNGIVEKMFFHEGDLVDKGGIIAQIDNGKVLNQLDELRISQREIEINRKKVEKKLVFVRENIKYLCRQVNRFKRLLKSQSIAGEKLETMELRLLEAETSRYELNRTKDGLDVQSEKILNRISFQELVLKDHTARSPVQGFIMEDFVSQGENVFVNTSIADILDPNSLYIEVFVDGNEISGLGLNQRAGIYIDGLENQEELSGVISYFGKKAEFSPKYIVSEKERKSLLYRVKVKIDRNQERFKLGMPVTVVFQKIKSNG